MGSNLGDSSVASLPQTNREPTFAELFSMGWGRGWGAGAGVIYDKAPGPLSPKEVTGLRPSSSRPEGPPDKVPLLSPALDLLVEAGFQQAVQHLLDQRPRLIA